MPLFNKCPYCHEHPIAIGTKPLTVGGVDCEVWVCGNCGHSVGISGVVNSAEKALETWNFLVDNWKPGKPYIN